MSNSTMERGAQNGGTVVDPAPGSLPDLLDYLADMIRELEEMAGRTPCPTLSGLLSLARSEALREREQALRSRTAAKA